MTSTRGRFERVLDNVCSLHQMWNTPIGACTNPSPPPPRGGCRIGGPTTVNKIGSEPRLGALTAEVLARTQKLARMELSLATAEGRRRAKQAGRAAALYGVATGLAILGAGCVV